MIALYVGVALALGGFALAVRAVDLREEARLDRYAADCVRAAAAEETRLRVCREAEQFARDLAPAAKPVRVPPGPRFAMLIEERGVLVPFPLPLGTIPTLTRGDA